MKRIITLPVILLLLTGSLSALYADDQAGDTKPKKIGFDFGLEYWTDYYYRGQSFYNATTGVFFPWFGYGIKGFYFMVSGEVAAESLGDITAGSTTPGGPGYGTDWYGVDFIISYNTTLAKLVKIGGRVAYFMYPASYSETGSAYLKDFVSARFKLGFNVLLQPTIQYDHNFWLGRGYTGTNGLLDGYLSVSIGHTFKPIPVARIHLGLKVGALWFDGRSGTMKIGFSDILANVKFSVTPVEGLSLYSSLNFGIAPNADFQYPTGDMFKWFAKFGISYSI